MYVQLVYLEVKAELLDAFLVEAKDNVRASLKESGVVRFDLLQQEDTPTKFIMYEIFRSPEDAEKHHETEHFKRWVEFGVPMLAKPRERVIYKILYPTDT